jgi:DNA-binding beta-propeller fold protein YncE
MKNSQRAKSSDWLTTSLYHATLNTAIVAVLLALLRLIDPSVATAKKNARPTRSTTIALTSDERNLVVVNREANSLSIIKVKNANGNDVSNKLAEIPVGEEPRCVAVSLDDRFAFVTNATAQPSRSST